MGRRQQGVDFIHLRAHSAYSLLEGAIKIPEMVELAQSDNMPALAITDRNNLFGALEYSESMRKAGIQPIIGCTLAVAMDAPGDDKPAGGAEPGHIAKDQLGFLVLYAKDRTGYANLMKLSSHAFLDCGDAAPPHVPLEVLKAHAQGLIALTGGPEGPVDRAVYNGQLDLARTVLDQLMQIFGDRLYLELQRYGGARASANERRLLKFAYDLNIPIVATNQCFFKGPGEFEAHDALICIAEGTYVSEDDRRRLTPDHYFKRQADMCDLFRDLPEAIANTVEIAKRCAYCPSTHDPILPQFLTGKNFKTAKAILEAEEKELRAQAKAGLKERLKLLDVARGHEEKEYWERLDYELGVISGMKFPGYFLIVADFIKWAKDNGIPVGPGRGSGAGSVVAWALTITDLDPLRFDLIFERFLNPERLSMPDFDIDFCQDRRDEVINYVQEKYGRDRVAQIITFGKLQARAVLRDVGRVLQMPYGQVDRLCKLVPNNPADPVTLEEAVNGEHAFREAARDDPLVKRMLDIGKKLEGLYRHASTHAAGVVIGDRPLTELVPLYQDPRSPLPATQFNMKWVEPAGLVKFDFLGLKTLTVIKKACDILAARGIELDPVTFPLDDPPTFEMLKKRETVGVFQYESAGMQDLMRKAQPENIEDLIAIVALYRPGPMENIPKYLAAKHGSEPPEFLHETVTPVLNDTYGVIIYQEQVLKIAQVLAGYSLGEADILRKAMGKKIKKEMDAQRERFVEGAMKNGVGKLQAHFIFDLVAKFAGYGFNKAHSACYAFVAYQTAYLKANYPVEFLAASMTLDMANAEKLATFAGEARRLKIEILPPCVNHSRADFTARDNAIRYALTALKNVGRAAVEHLCEERDENGPFESLADFAGRINPRLINKRALETLAAAGAFDAIHPNRAEVLENVETMIAHAQRMAVDREAGQNDLFAGESDDAALPLNLRETREWLPATRLSREFDAVGFFLSGHPIDEYEQVLEDLGVTTWTELNQNSSATKALLAGTATSVKERNSARGNRYAFVSFSDPTGQFEALLFSDVLDHSRDMLNDGSPVLITVEAERDGESTKLRALSIEHLDKAARNLQKDMTITVSGGTDWRELASAISKKGDANLKLRIHLPDCAREIELKLPEKYDLSPSTRSIIRQVSGVVEMRDD